MSIEIARNNQAHSLIRTMATTRPSAVHETRQAGGADTDSVSISSTALRLSKVATLPNIRMDLVESVRAAIAEGRYETEDKINQAIDNLLGEIL